MKGMNFILYQFIKMLNLERNILYKILDHTQKGKLLDIILEYEKHLKNKLQNEFKNKYLEEDSTLAIIFWQIRSKMIISNNETKQNTDIKTLITKELIEQYWQDTIDAFCFYRWESDSKGKQRWEKQKIFNLKMRLDRRKMNEKTNFGRKPLVRYDSIAWFAQGMKEGKMEEMKKELWIEKYLKMKNEWKDSADYLR